MSPTEVRPAVYVTHHRPSHLVEADPVLRAIQVGDGAPIPGVVCRDNTGDHIADRNPHYCELTAQYWMWRSAPPEATHLGLLHYRRFLDFHQGDHRLDPWGVVHESAFTHGFQQRYGLTAAAITAAVEQADLILPRPWSVRQAGFRNLRAHYERSPHHHAADLQQAEHVLAEWHPHLLKPWQQLLNGHQAYFNNMFVLRRDLFERYCQWLFPLLEAIESRLPIETYNQQEARVIGYLSERLFNLWIHQLRAEQPQLRVLELDRVFVDNTEPKCWDPPIPAASHPGALISAVIASDNHYTPHLGALIVSLLDNLSPNRQLDLLVLDGGITEHNRKLLRRLVPAPHQLQFVPMADEFRGYFVHMHFSRTTFYRLVLDQLLQTRSKVIYLDCDTIVLGDLADLWDCNLQGQPIAAVPDVIMEHFCITNTLSADFTGSQPASRYLSRTLGLDGAIYFQAGVLVMDLEAIRSRNLGPKMVNDLLEQRFWFLDQDVLNKYFAHSYLPLPQAWNYVNCQADVLASVSQASRLQLQAAAASPQLIHYAGYEAKPWVNAEAWLAVPYFYYLRKTFWYEQVIRSLTAARRRGWKRPLPNLQRAARSRWRHLPQQLRQRLNPLAYRLLRALSAGR